MEQLPEEAHQMTYVCNLGRPHPPCCCPATCGSAYVLLAWLCECMPSGMMSLSGSLRRTEN